MKKILTFAVIALALTSCEDGSYFDGSTVQLKSLHVGRIEAVGNDLRVYEFSPQSSPNKVCIFVAGEKKAGLECYDK